MLKLIKSMFGAAPSEASLASAMFGPDRRSAARQGETHVPERRVASVPPLVVDQPPLPEVDEGNSDADWERWQDSVMAQEGHDPTAGAAIKPPLPYERRKEPRAANAGPDSVRMRG
jgi:hypothetical protein